MKGEGGGGGCTCTWTSKRVSTYNCKVASPFAYLASSSFSGCVTTSLWQQRSPGARTYVAVQVLQPAPSFVPRWLCSRTSFLLHFFAEGKTLIFFPSATKHLCSSSYLQVLFVVRSFPPLWDLCSFIYIYSPKYVFLGQSAEVPLPVRVEIISEFSGRVRLSRS